MILNVSCPHCGALLDVTPDWLGQQLECGGCSSVFVCPELAEEAPPVDAPKTLREKPSRRERNRTRPEDGDRWEGYEAYSQDDDPDSHLSKKRGPGFATASMVLGIISLTVATPITVVTCGFGGFVRYTRADGRTATCPAGNSSLHIHRNKDGFEHTWSAKMCSISPR